MKKESVSSFKETSEIRLTLDDYNDIFSDFDPRPYSEKGLSEDFLEEAKRATISKYSDKVNFIMALPQEKRNLKNESIIKLRLKEYFQNRYILAKKEKRSVLKKGLSFCSVGTILMMIVTYLYFKFKDINLLTSFFIILLEPASWFLFWEGLDLVIFESKEINPNLKFYGRMIKADLKFISA